MGCRVDTAEPAPTTYAQAIKTRGPQVEAGRRMAVNGVDRSSDVGVHGMLGPNRAGKTTLIRSLATIPRPKERSLDLSGHATGGIDLRGRSRELGRPPQEFGLHSRFTVREFVEYMAWLKEVPQADIPRAAQRAIERVGLDGRADDRMTTLPEGILRRAGIAQAIVDDPRILLVDEPAIRPGPARQVRSWEPVHVPSADTCAVVSAHLVEGVALACTDVVPIDEERLTSQGTPWELAAADFASGAGDTSTEQRCTALHTRDHEQAGVAR